MNYGVNFKRSPVFEPAAPVESDAPARLMVESDVQHLRVLIANERRDRLELLAKVVIGLGHDVIAREIYVKEVGAATAREHPDVALVGLGSSSEHALACAPQADESLNAAQARVCRL